LYTGPPRGKYTNALCNMCNSEVRDLAPGRWICRNDHTVDSATSPEDQLPYRAWGRIQGALYLFPFLLLIHSTSTLCITLGLPLVDAHGTRLTVTMNSDAAECAFGSLHSKYTEDCAWCNRVQHHSCTRLHWAQLVTCVCCTFSATLKLHRVARLGQLFGCSKCNTGQFESCTELLESATI